MTSTNKSNQNLLITAAIIIFGLLAAVVTLWVNNRNFKKDLSQTTVELDEARELEEQANRLFEDSQAELEELRISNADKDAMISGQIEQLKAQKSKIDVLIRNKKDLSAARAEIENMTLQVQGYLAEIDKLKAENQVLNSSVATLSTEKSKLENEVTEQSSKIGALTTEALTLTSEKSALEETKMKLSAKVGRASVIHTNGLHVDAVKIRNNGNEAKKKYAKSVDKINICFNASANAITESGQEVFYVRVINPVGETMAMENLGSGILTLSDNNNQIRYTTAVEVDYANDQVDNICAYWQPGTEFQEGTYDVEVYNKGHLAGKTGFTLK